MSSQQQQGIPAVGLLVAAFTNESGGDQTLAAMKDAKKKQEFYYEDAAVIKQDAKGKVHYTETGDMSTGKGAGIGALVGGILGILGGPGGVALGASAGAAIGGAVAHKDKGFRNESLGTIGTALKPGTSAIAAITSLEFLKAVQKNVPVEDIRTAISKLAAELSYQLSQNKNVAIGLILTEQGLGIKEIAAGADSTTVINAVFTDDAVAAGAVVTTAQGTVYKVGIATADGGAVETGTITDDGTVIPDTLIVAVPESALDTTADPAPATDAAADTATVADTTVADTTVAEEKPADAATAA